MSDHENEQSYELLSGIRCTRCGSISFNRNDVEQRYCGGCRTFHEPATGMNNPVKIAERLALSGIEVDIGGQLKINWQDRKGGEILLDGQPLLLVNSFALLWGNGDRMWRIQYGTIVDPIVRRKLLGK